MSPNFVTNVCRCGPDATRAPTDECTRRRAIGVMLGLGLTVLLDGCGSDAVAPASDDAIVIDGQIITLRLDRLDALRAADTAFVLGSQNTIVLRIADRDYRAFSNVCTHAGCGISQFAQGRMQCQCHLSEFNTDGLNVAGPALLPLPSYPTTLDAAGTTLTITRTA